jgi:hypothetical protein
LNLDSDIGSSNTSRIAGQPAHFDEGASKFDALWNISVAQLKKAAISHLRKLQKSPQRVRKYFQHKPVRYAA